MAERSAVTARVFTVPRLSPYGTTPTGVRVARRFAALRAAYPAMVRVSGAISASGAADAGKRAASRLRAACAAPQQRANPAPGVAGVQRRAHTRVGSAAIRKRAGSLSLSLGSPARCAKARCRLRVRAAGLGTPGGGKTDKSRLRTILRAVHPDRFTADPRARELNTLSLQKLNAYVDALSSNGRRCEPTSVRFVVHGDNGALREVQAALPAGGSLQPLFAAFELRSSSGVRRRRASLRDEELVAWLASHMGEASARRELYESRSAGLVAAKAALESEFGLRHLHLGYVAEGSSAEPAHLAALAEALRCFSAEQAAAFAEATIVLADRTEMPRSGARAASADGAFLLAEDGKLWLSLCTDWRPLWRFLRDADLAWAAAAGNAAASRAAAVHAALPGLAELLRVKYIYAPSTIEASSFCEALSDAAAVLSAAPPAGPFRFGVSLCSEIPAGDWNSVWADPGGRTMIAYAFGQRSIEVDARCSPFALAQFLLQHGARCDAECGMGDAARAMLESVQSSLLASLGITLSVSALLNDGIAVTAGERLLAAAAELRTAVGEKLDGTKLMLVADTDVCRYQVLAAGTLCVPVGFQVEEVVRAVLGQQSAAACAR